jgi:glutathione reductase (NADPH)
MASKAGKAGKADKEGSVADYDYDLFVIGAGSGGVRASRLSASMGARVAVAEERFLGGTCVNVGCIPKKLFVYASSFHEELEEAIDGYGWSVPEIRFDWQTLIENKNREIERLNGIYDKLLSNAGVERIDGRARIVDPHTLEIAGRRCTARYILVATGSRPYLPEQVEGIEHAIVSDDAFYLEQLPERAIICGGGYIAVEFACIFHGLGVDVTQLYRGPLFLRGFDDDVRTHLAAQMRAKGIDLRFDLDPRKLEKLDDGVRLTLQTGEVVEGDFLLCATGRVPYTQDLGLESAGVELARNGAVVVDEYSRSTVESIFAIGDVTDRVNLTPVAIHEGICLANTLFNDKPMQPNHWDIPAAVFSQPPVGTVGLTEAEAREKYDAVDIYRSEFRALKQTLTSSPVRSLMKLVVDRTSDRVVGLHMVGHDAGEITQGFAVAIKAGLTKAQFDETIGIHPTAAEEFVTMREPVAQT